MENISVKRKLLEDVLDQLKGAQSDCYVQSTQNVIDELEVAFRQKPVIGGSNELIQFAEWLSDNEWVKKTFTHPNKVGKYYSHKHCEYKTIEQLFDMFSGIA